MKTVFKKIVLYFLIMFMICIAVLQLPYVKNSILKKTTNFLHTTHNIDVQMNSVGGIWPFTLTADDVKINAENIDCHLKTIFISLDVWSTLTFRPKIKFIQIKKSFIGVLDGQQEESGRGSSPEDTIKDILLFIKQPYVKRVEMDHIQIKGFESCVFACRYKPIADGSHLTLTPIGHGALIDAQLHQQDGMTVALLNYDTKNVSCISNMIKSIFKNISPQVREYAEKLNKLSCVLKVKDFNIRSLTADVKTKAQFVNGDFEITGAIENSSSYSVEAYNTTNFDLPVFGKLLSLSSVGSITKQKTLNINKFILQTQNLTFNLSGNAQGKRPDNFLSLLGSLYNAQGEATLSGPFIKEYLNIESCKIGLKSTKEKDAVVSEILLSKELCKSERLNQILITKEPIKIYYNNALKAIFTLVHDNILTLQANSDFSKNMLILKSESDDSFFENSEISINIKDNKLIINGDLKPRGDNIVKIDMSSDLKFDEINGNVFVNIKDMAPISTLFDFATVGHLEGNINFKRYNPQRKKGSVTLDFISKYFRSPLSKTERVTIKGELNGDGSLKLDKKIEQLAIGKFFLAQTGSTTISGNIFKEILFSVQANSHKIGYLSSPVKIDIQGKFNIKKNDIDLKVFHVEHLKQKIHLKKQTLIKLSPIKIQDTTLETNDGEIHFKNIQHHQAKQWTGLITLSKIPVGLLNWFLYKTLLVGKINGDIIFSGTKETPDIKATIIAKGLQWGQLNVFSPGAEETLDCDLQLIKKGDQIIWGTKLVGKDLADFTANGSFYLNGFNEQPITGSLKGYLDLSLISAIAATGDRLSGKIDCQMALSGTVTKPTINGNIYTKDAFVELAEFGTVINKITAHLKAQGTRVTIQSLSATDDPLVSREKKNNSGTLKMSGHIDFANLLEPNVKMDFIVRNFLLVNSDSIVGTGSGDLKIQGEGVYSIVTGHADIEKISINLNELDTADDIPMIHLKDPKKRKYAKEYQKEHNTKKGRDILPLDLILKTHGKLIIHGNLISNSVWGGDIGVIGPIAGPALDGKLALKSGILDFFGTSLKIESASVAFTKYKRNDAWLLMTAGKTVRDVELRMIIDTNQDSPITFKSSPSYAQDEVLALMLFGKVAGSVSAGQSIQLAAALGRLKGKKGFNLMDDIRKGFGFDTFEIAEQVDSNAAIGDNKSTNHAVRIGKKITDSTEVIVEQGAGQGTSKLGVETSITDNLSFEAVIAAQRRSDNNEYDQSSSGSSAGFVWSKRY